MGAFVNKILPMVPLEKGSGMPDWLVEASGGYPVEVPKATGKLWCAVQNLNRAFAKIEHHIYRALARQAIAAYPIELAGVEPSLLAGVAKAANATTPEEALAAWDGVAP
jgi:hypothetical protein